jgi:MerR family copper efflux transcriptional regulator
MNISDVASRAGLPAKTIRYYEDIGLIKPLRDPNGYRAFRDSDLHKLTFLARARALGFTIENCRALLALWEDKARASADVRAIAADHLSEIEIKIADLTAMRDTLTHLVQTCAGNSRPDCPILTSLGEQRLKGAPK